VLNFFLCDKKRRIRQENVAFHPATNDHIKQVTAEEYLLNGV
jgi:hypothetical protein